MGVRVLEGLDEVTALEVLKCERAFEGCNGVRALEGPNGCQST